MNNGGEQLVRDTPGNIFVTCVDSGGLRLNRYDGVTGALSEGIVVDLNGQTPSISYDDLGNFIYLAYSIPGVELRVIKYNPLSLSSPLWNVSYGFFAPINGFNPKMITPWTTNKSTDPRNVQVVYVDHLNLISILDFDPSTGGLLRKLDTGFATSEKNTLSVKTSRFNIYIAHRKTSTTIEVLRYNAKNFARDWFSSITTSGTDPSNILLTENPTTRIVYISFKNGSSSDFRLSKILSNGTVDWTSSSALSVTSGINGVMHNLYLFQDLPMLTYISSSGDVTFAKVSDTTGTVITPFRTTALPGFVAGNVSGSPGIFTEFPWDKLYVSYVSSVTGTLQFQRFTSTLTTVITEAVSELSQYQVGVNTLFQNSYTISRDSLGQIRILGRKSDNTTLFDTVVSSSGQTPALVASNNTLYFLVSKMKTSFSEYLEFTITRASSLTVGTPDWTNTVIIPVTSAVGIRPRLVGTNSRLYVVYARTDGYIYIDSFINSSGNASNSLRLNNPSSNISELAVSNTSGNTTLIVGTPSSSDVNKVTVTSILIPSLTVNFSLDVTLGDPLTPKTELYVRQPTTSETGDFYVVGKTSTGQYLASYVSTTGVSPTITVSTPWDVNCSITNVLGNRLIACHLFQDYLLLFYVESIGTNDLVCKKIASNGLVTSRSLTVLAPPTANDQLCLIPQMTTLANFFVSQKNNLTSVTNAYYGSIPVQYSSSLLRELSKYQHVEDIDNTGFQYIAYHQTNFINNYMKVIKDGVETIITVPPGNYTINQLVDNIVTQINAATGLVFTYNINTSTFKVTFEFAGSNVVKFLFDSASNDPLTTALGFSLGEFTFAISALPLPLVGSKGTLTSLYAAGVGAKLEKRNSSGALIASVVMDANGYNPSIFYRSGYVYAMYSTLSVTLTDFVTMTLKKYNVSGSGISTVWTTSQVFPDGNIESFFPRLTIFSSSIHAVYVRNNDGIYSSVYGISNGKLTPTTPYNTGLTVGSSLDRREMKIAATSFTSTGVYYLHIGFPDDSANAITVARFNSANYTKIWETSISTSGGSDARGLFMEEDTLYRSVIVSFTNVGDTTHRVSRILTTGTAQVGFQNVNSTLSGLVGNRMSSMYVFDDFILLFGIRSATGSVETIKLLVDTGVVLTPTTINSVGLSLTDVSGTPVILSRDPWSNAIASYLFITNLLPSVQNLNVAGAVSVTVTTTEVSQYQTAIDSADNVYPIYYGGAPEGVAMTKFDIDGGTRLQRRFEFNGQTPAICIDPENEAYLYVAYTKNVSAFTNYVAVSLKKVRTSNLTDVWSFSKLFIDPVASTFRPRIQVSGTSVYVVYVDNSDQIVIQENDKNSGTLLSVTTPSGLTAPGINPTEISIRTIPNAMFIAYPNGPTSMRLGRLNLATKTLTWDIPDFQDSVPGVKTAIVIQHSDAFGTYVSYATGGSTLRVSMVNSNSGATQWSTALTSLTGIYGGRAHAFYLIGGLPLVFAIEEVTANLKVTKLNSDGSVISTRSKHLETFDTDLFVSYPAIFSRENWDSIWLVYPDPTGPLYENWAILVNKLVASEMPDPSSNEVVLSEKQFAIDTSDNMYLAYIKEYRPDITTLPSSIPENWLNEYGTVSLINANTPVPKIYLVDSSVTGEGLTVYVEKSPDVSGYGSSFTKLKVTLINSTPGTTMSNIRIEDEVVPSGFVLHKFTAVPTLLPGQTLTTSMDIDFNGTYLIDLPFNIKTTFSLPLPLGTAKTYPVKLANPSVYDIKVTFQYSKDISIFGNEFTKINLTIQNRMTDFTLTNVSLDNVTVPSGMTFNGFSTIPSISPLETVSTTLNIDFSEILATPITFTLKSTSTFTNPVTSTSVSQAKRFTGLSIVAPSNDLFFGTNGPNVVSISKVSSDGVVRLYNDIDVGGESPAIFVDNGDVYSAYSKRLVTFTEFMSITIQKSNSNLDPEWIVTRRYTDSFVEYFKPRIQKTSKGIHLVYFRQDEFLYIETFNPLTGELIGSPLKTTIESVTITNPEQLATYSTTDYLYVALPEPGTGNIKAYKFDAQTLTVVWSTTFNGGTPLNAKSGLVMKCSANDPYDAPENVFIAYADNMTDIKLTMLNAVSGSVAWTSSCGLSLADIYDKRIHGMVVFGGYPSMFFIRDRTTYTSCTGVKFNDLGAIIDTKDVSLPTELEPALIDGYPIVLTRSPWDVIFMEFYTLAELDYVEVSPTRRLGVVAVEAPFSYTIDVPESELSEFQMGSLTAGNTFLVYTDQNVGLSGVRLVKTNSITATVLSDILVDLNGQSPSVYVQGNYVYVSYIRYQSAFLGSTMFVRKKYLATSTPPTLLHTEETGYPDSTPSVFRPRLVASYDHLYAAYARQDGLVYLEKMSLNTVETDIVFRTSFNVSGIDPLSIVAFSGPDNFNLAFPNGGVLNQVILTKYDADLAQLWSITTTETGCSELMVREDFGTFLIYNQGGDLKLAKFNKDTGGLEWLYNIGLASNFVGGRVHSFYSLFNYPLIFNIEDISGNARAIKFSTEGELVSDRSTALVGLTTSEIQDYPVVISRSPWNTLSLGYYAGTGVGSITVSPTKTIAIRYFSATLTNPLPLPVLEVSDNQVDVYEDYAYYVHTDDALGLLVTKHLRSSGAVVNSYSIPISPGIPFSPCLRYIPSTNRLCVSYCTFTVGYTEIVEMFMVILNANDLSLITSTSRGLPDPSPDTFIPRISLSGDQSSIHRVYERYVHDLVIERFDLTSYEITDPVNTGIHYLGGSVRDISLARGGQSGIEDAVYLVYPPVSDLTKVNVRKYLFDSVDDEYDQIWESSGVIGSGYPGETKKFTLTRADDSSVYVSYTSGGSKLLITRLEESDGSVDWTSLILIIPGSQRLSHGMDIFKGFPMVYTIRSSTNEVVFSKFNPDTGLQVSSRATSLVGFNYSTNVTTSTSPVVLSYYPWEYITAIHFTPTVGLYYQPSRNVSVRRYTAAITYELPSHSADVRTSQGAYQEEGTAQVVSYTSPGGANLYYFDGSVISGTTLISSNGYRPALTKIVTDLDFLFVSYMESFNTFTEVHRLGLSRYNLLGTTSWARIGDEDLIFPDGSFTNFRPLVKVYADRLFLVYVREDGFMVIEERSKLTGDLVNRLVTAHYVPNPTEMVVDGDYDLCIGYVNGGDQIKLVKYEITNGAFGQAWVSILTASTTLEKRSLELVQNISEHIIVSYLGYNSITGLQDAYTFRVNQLTGALVWSLPITTNLPTTLRLSGINYEGSFVNTTRVSVSSTIDVTTFSANALGNVTKLYTGSLPSGTPLYAGNPLVMFNQGEGWVIFAYRDTLGTFRMLRAVVGEGSVRVDYDSQGYAITPGYEYWWRPRIFINPSIRGTDVEERTLVGGKLDGIYRKWYPNGHIQTVRFYDEGELISYEQNFSNNGQWDKEIVNYAGNSTLREWKLPMRTDLLAVFNNFDTNDDGFISESELLAGLTGYGLTIPVEQFELLVQRMDKDASGNINYREFASVVPVSPYTNGITSTIGFDHAIKVLDCQITNGKRNGVCTEYFNTLPAERVHVVSNYTNEKLNGPYVEYHNDESTKVEVTYVAGKRFGVYEEFNTLEYGNSLRQQIYYDPPGRENGVKYIYDAVGGWAVYQSTLLDNPANPTIWLEIINRWSATVIKNQYYVDYKKRVSGAMSTNLKIGPYVEYYESGALRVTGTYVRGLKSGLWTTYYETPNVKRLEENYVKNRLSGVGGRKTYSTSGVLISSEDFPVYT